MEAISPLTALANYNRLSQAAAASGVNSRAGEEFLTVFYKEMLKEAIKAPSFSYDPDNKSETETFFSTYNTDLLVEQFAKQLAKNQIARPGWLPAEEVK
jgi:Rod binding domain-containing protein